MSGIASENGYAASGGVQYEVTPEYLAQAASDSSFTAGQLANQTDALQKFCSGLEDVWKGMAKEQFNTLMAEYRTYATMLYDALSGISSGLHGTYLNYVGGETTNINNLIALGEDLTPPPTGTNFD
ncbi:WXG100 family type VII secretion target [Streptomyces sp. NPDC048281]|uniref:WXG100 family type VII secretion target n=1 Tax=Streptomyces sp. NPDC048281 TaxID=3154715 RepID=UPI00341FE02E